MSENKGNEKYPKENATNYLAVGIAVGVALGIVFGSNIQKKEK
ncbi:hypothetical protein tinsulaeT_02070 [Thalassotalea insulae]|uniref:Uncharacterized protein n=1 Tax=Thalassotalea insulae TaxID=2056778 RepID=A0ABQ6GNC2_9GAMM|nr:hypothetical protein [Thalassotalea insulae]GLX76867.1 hypothetical protein tinsulaeT_02070 [Thalassotalea insulae]